MYIYYNILIGTLICAKIIRKLQQHIVYRLAIMLVALEIAKSVFRFAGHLFDQQKYACARYFDGFTIRTGLFRCDNCTRFTCGDGQCTMKEWKCNDVKNCLDGTDEVVYMYEILF